MAHKRVRAVWDLERIDIPFALLKAKVFPLSFESLGQAKNVLLVCRTVYAMRETREFWTPFLVMVRNARIAWLSRNGHLHLANAMEALYVMFPASMTVLEAVRSKFFFAHVPPSFPLAHQSSLVAANVLHGDLYREVAPGRPSRNVLVHQVCEYTPERALFYSINGRDYLAAYPSRVSVSGFKSSRGRTWWRMGQWCFSGPEFLFQGLFSRQTDTSSTGHGVLRVGGVEKGAFRVYNVDHVDDSNATLLGFIGELECFVVDVRTGVVSSNIDSVSYPLLQQAIARPSDPIRNTGTIQIAEFDYGNRTTDEATYVCRFPEGTFTADEIAFLYGEAGVHAVVKFDERNNVPSEAERIIRERSDAVLVRWKGYGKSYDTWEKKDDLP